MKSSIFGLVGTAAIASLLCGACGAKEQPTPSESAAAKTPAAPAATPAAKAPRPEPVTIASGNSLELVFTSGSAEFQTGSDYTMKYTLVDVTTHAPTDALVFRDKYAAPGETDQMVRVRVNIEMAVLRGLKCKNPSDGFSLHVGSEAKKVQKFSGFEKEFAKTLATSCLALGESQTLDVWFKLPADADLKGAEFSLYRGSAEEPLKTELLPN